MESLEIEVLLVAIILMFYLLAAQYLENKKCVYFHESIVSIAFGAIAGIMVYYLSEHERIEFSTGLFFYFVLPPIIFSAGYTLKSKRFFVNIGFITLYGFLGTFFSFITIGLLSLFLNANGVTDTVLTTKECLLLACVLSATDTVAAHSVVKETKYPRLNSILFGEGVINDAVSIVLFRTVGNLGDNFGTIQIFGLIFNFIYTTFASILIGMGVGLLTALILRRLKGINQHPDRETTFIILAGYASYMISEMINLSGIMTIFCCGVTLAHYAWYSLSRESQQGTSLVFVVISQGAEAFTFTYLGMVFVTFPLDQYDFLFLLCMFVAMIAGRGLSMFGSSLIVYAFQCGHFGLETNNICVGWFSGLIRGAVAFALVLQVEGENKELLVSTTLGIALFTTVFLSTLLGPFTQFVGLESDRQEVYYDIMSGSGPEDALYHQHVRESGLSYFHRILQKVDEKYLTPIFGGEARNDSKEAWRKLWEDDGIEISQLS